jgi:ectoine hydroxylase-related dioxygenase (phytanoyl-CoA dioxygenase family)
MEEYKEHYVELENVNQKLEQDGVAVIKNVLNSQEIEQAKNGMWQTLNKLTENLDKPIEKEDPLTWKSFYSLFPIHSMLVQHWSIGQSQYVWDVRQNPKVVNVFKQIWNDNDLLTSFDGVSVHFPPEKTNRGWYRGNDWFHTDQSSRKEGLKCIQGMITLYDVNKGDATLRVLKGTNKKHQSFFQDNGIDEKSDWYKLKDDEINYFDDDEKNCVLAKAGSMILWDSRTFHQGIEPRKTREKQNFRGIVYVCMTPRKWSDDKNLLKKQKAFNEMRLTTHWPHKVKLFPKNPRTYGKDIENIGELDNPILSNLGKKLAGF